MSNTNFSAPVFALCLAAVTALSPGSPAVAATAAPEQTLAIDDKSAWDRYISIRRAMENGGILPEPVSSSPTTPMEPQTPTTSIADSEKDTPPPTDNAPPAVPPEETPQRPSPEAALEPMVYTRVPRTHGQHTVTLRGGESYTLHSPDIWDRLPDTKHVFDGFNAPGQLVYRDVDGSERVLYDCMQREKPCVPLDPAVSLDGSKILFSVYRADRLRNAYLSGTTLPNQQLGSITNAQLHIVDVASGEVHPLPQPAGALDVSPTWLPDGRIMFASNRDPQREPFLDRITPNNRADPRFYIANADGSDVHLVTQHEVSTAMHPYLLRSGRVAYGSQWLSHNLPYMSTNGGVNWPGTLDNMWVVMDMDYRGGDMTALYGAHRASLKTSTGRTKHTKALHFLGERRNGDVCVANYYRGNNLGLGDVICWAPEPVGIEGALPRFQPRKLYNVADWSRSDDNPSFRENGIYQGKIGYPEGAPNNQLLLTVGRGYCTQVSGSVTGFQNAVAGQPGKLACDTGLYLTTRIPSRDMDDLTLVVDAPEWHEFGARMVVARQVDTPALSNTSDGSCQLASSDAGTAETAPYKPYHFNHNYRVSANNGGEIDGLPHSQLAGIRFWEVIPNGSRRSFSNFTGNRLRLLGDTPLLADKSFKVSLPCDTPYIMAGIDARGRVIKRDQIPQSLRPGEKRVCSGCHLHSRKGRPYENSEAFLAEPVALTSATPVPVYERDIKPIFARRCLTCHVSDVPLMDYDDLVWDQFQTSVTPERRLQVSQSSNEKRRFGLQRPYTSKYVNSMFARESLLYWKAANERTDGRSDATYSDDIDFGPPHPTDITDDELRILAEWIDSGATRIIPN
ncbi:PD40 domain-containing protein [Parahaliea aestuarii]|nr:PD40 domain-containing protein [Parahaliea aestuarii]